MIQAFRHDFSFSGFPKNLKVHFCLGPFIYIFSQSIPTFSLDWHLGKQVGIPGSFELHHHNLKIMTALHCRGPHILLSVPIPNRLHSNRHMNRHKSPETADFPCHVMLEPHQRMGPFINYNKEIEK